MTRIEIWKGKSPWYAMSLDKRHDLIHQLALVLENSRNKLWHGELGPYIVHKQGSDLLIWATENCEIASISQYQEIKLADFFEPLVYVSATKHMDAKSLAMKLSG